VAVAQRLIQAGHDPGLALRRAAVTALSTRTELRDELGADFRAALDEILDAVEGLDLVRLQASAGGAEDGEEAGPKA
jgi:hypothetical protein